jgi:hypothetical protein
LPRFEREGAGMGGVGEGDSGGVVRGIEGCQALTAPGSDA